MKLINPLKYNLKTTLKGIGFFYAIVVTIIFIIPSIVAIFAGSSAFNMNGGFDNFTGIFIFVCGCVFVKGDLKTNLQLGRSRKTSFVITSLCLLFAVLVTTLVDSILSPIAESISYGHFKAYMLVKELYLDGAYTFWQLIAISTFWRFFLYMGLGFLGYTLSSINFRLNHLGRWIFWVGVPTAFIALMVKFAHSTYTNGVFARILCGLFGITNKNVFTFALTITVLTAIGLVISRLCQRKVAVDRA